MDGQTVRQELYSMPPPKLTQIMCVTHISYFASR